MKNLTRITLIALLLFSQLAVNAQQNKIDAPETFYRYLGTTIKYPKQAADAGLQGYSIVNFKVSKQKLSSVTVATNLGNSCDKEVVKCISSYPSFSEFKDGNYALKVKFSLSHIKDGTIKNAGAQAPKGAQELNELVILGYGPAQKTGANGNKSPIKLLGELSNVTIKDANGNIINTDSRGTSSPMYVVNGKVITDNSIKEVNPDSIVSIEVLKDSAAVAMYGAEAKNGVIHVNTMQSEKVIESEKNSSIILRGKNLLDRQPLYILEGKAIEEYEMKMIDPNKISSVTVLKDDNAIKKYGHKGRNGVVEIELRNKVNNN